MAPKTPARRPGRPAAAKKAVTIQVRLTADEAASLRARADAEARPLSNFARMVLRQAVGLHSG